MADPWIEERDGLALWLRLTPKGGRDALEGIETLADGRVVLKARVRSAPEDGRANAALIALLATALHAPKSAFTLVSGQTARLKKIHVAGDPASLKTALAQLLAQGPR
ncbi:DUF167 family protein [Methylocystis bryophila]|uniref:UPF0235 protein B1812_00610 n=1 Tax=Methylocystis bryophila TaxID=655015 RepID=A0A1W6MQE3_9HYPH|nr:DUF167 family protein [Methylocystis bryophila]ARN79814.1 hypothetical protein B1812_00610 [Methylocystis bryophila]BDV39698.1 UPF0235 protein [Methylocystis bryophila]